MRAILLSVKMLANRRCSPFSTLPTTIVDTVLTYLPTSERKRIDFSQMLALSSQYAEVVPNQPECQQCHSALSHYTQSYECGCPQAFFCSINCQREAWHAHHNSCPSTSLSSSASSSSDNPSERKQCSECGMNAQECARGKLLRCARCSSVYYCSRACQRKAWPRHKEKCSKLLLNNS